MSGKSLGLAIALLLAPIAANAGPPQSPLLFPLPESVLDGREHRLDFVVVENLNTTLKESLSFKAEDATGYPVVEILALHPQILKRLRETDSFQSTRISVYLDGSLAEEHTVPELAARSQEIWEMAPFLIGVRARAIGSTRDLFPTKSTATAYGCVHQCDLSAQSCDSICLRYPNPYCEDRCDTRYSNCLHGCGCPVAIQEWTVTTAIDTLVSPRVTVCLSDGDPVIVGHWYDKYTHTDKNEHYQTIVQCDGTWTQVLVSVDYSNTNYNCWKRTPNTPISCTANVNYPPTSSGTCILK